MAPIVCNGLTTSPGRFSCTWNPAMLKGCPLGLAGKRAPVVTTSLSTMFPTGVPGQYSS